MKKSNRLISLYFRDIFKDLLIYILLVFIMLLVAKVYHLPMGIIIYAITICTSLGLVFLGYDFYKYSIKHKILIDIRDNIGFAVEKLPKAEGLEEEDYQRLIHTLYRDKAELLAKTDKKHKDLEEYYTLWTHQIKTPIAAIHLLLQLEDKDINEDLELQIFEIENYVDMALQYLRIDSMTSDLKLEEYSVRAIVKKAVRSYSKLFIYKGISLDLKEGDMLAITDKKWLLFVIKQVLSNALKYTNKGKITIEIKDKILILKDSGMGISKEDIPRIFEKGFTGYAGRIDERSTGLGLYLSKKILDNLGHRIEVNSQVELGTEVRMDLSLQNLEIK